MNGCCGRVTHAYDAWHHARAVKDIVKDLQVMCDGTFVSGCQKVYLQA